MPQNSPTLHLWVVPALQTGRAVLLPLEAPPHGLPGLFTFGTWGVLLFLPALFGLPSRVETIHHSGQEGTPLESGVAYFLQPTNFLQIQIFGKHLGILRDTVSHSMALALTALPQLLPRPLHIPGDVHWKVTSPIMPICLLSSSFLIFFLPQKLFG